jgi:hypothetical protein
MQPPTHHSSDDDLGATLPTSLAFLRSVAVVHGIFNTAVDLSTYVRRFPAQVISAFHAIGQQIDTRGAKERIAGWVSSSSEDLYSPGFARSLFNLEMLFVHLSQAYPERFSMARPFPWGRAPVSLTWKSFPFEWLWLIPVVEKYAQMDSPAEVDAMLRSASAAQRQQLGDVYNQVQSSPVKETLLSWMYDRSPIDIGSKGRLFAFLDLINKAVGGQNSTNDNHSQAPYSHDIRRESPYALGAGASFSPWSIGSDDPSIELLCDIVQHSNSAALKRDAETILYYYPAQNREAGIVIARSLAQLSCDCDEVVGEAFITRARTQLLAWNVCATISTDDLTSQRKIRKAAKDVLRSLDSCVS